MNANEKENAKHRPTVEPLNVPDTSSQPEEMKTGPAGMHNYEDDLSKSVSRSKLRVSWPPPKNAHENIGHLPTDSEVRQVKSGQHSPISPVEANGIGLQEINAATSSPQKHKFKSKHYKTESNSNAFADDSVLSTGSSNDAQLRAREKADLNIGAQELKLSFAPHSKAEEPKQQSVSEKIAIFQDISSSKSSLQHKTKESSLTSPTSLSSPSGNATVSMVHNISPSSSQASDDPSTKIMPTIPCSINESGNSSHDTPSMKNTDKAERDIITDGLGDNEIKEGEAAASHEENISDHNITTGSEEKLNPESNAEQVNVNEENSTQDTSLGFGLFDDDDTSAETSHYRNHDAPFDYARNYPHVDIINQNNYNTMKTETFSEVKDTKRPLYIRTETQEETYRDESDDEHTSKSEPQEPVSVTFSDMLEDGSGAESIISGSNAESSATALSNHNEPTVNEQHQENTASVILESPEAVTSDTVDLSHKNIMSGVISEISFNEVNVHRSSLLDVPEETSSQMPASDILNKSENHEFSKNSSLENAPNLENIVSEPYSGQSFKAQNNDGGVTLEPQQQNSIFVSCEKDNESMKQEMPMKDLLSNVQIQNNGLLGSDSDVRDISMNYQGALADETKQGHTSINVPDRKEALDKCELSKDELTSVPASEIKMSESLNTECDAVQKKSIESDLQGKIYTEGQNNEISIDSSILKNESKISDDTENITQSKENKKGHARKESLTKSPGLGRSALSKLFTAGSKDASSKKEQSEKKKPSTSKSSSAFGKLFRSSSEKAKEEIKQPENLPKDNEELQEEQMDNMQPEQTEDEHLSRVSLLPEMPAQIPVKSEIHVSRNGKQTNQELMEVQDTQQNKQPPTNSNLLEVIKPQNAKETSNILESSVPLTIYTDSNTEKCSKINSQNLISESMVHPDIQAQIPFDPLNQDQDFSQTADNIFVTPTENSQTTFRTSEYMPVSLVSLNTASVDSGNGSEQTLQNLSLSTTETYDISDQLFSDISDHCKQEDNLVQSFDSTFNIIAGSGHQTVNSTEQISAVPHFTDDSFGLLNTTPLNQTLTKENETSPFALPPSENTTKKSSDDIFDIFNADVSSVSQVQNNTWGSHDITKEQFSTGMMSSSSSEDPFGTDNIFFGIADPEKKQSICPSSSLNNGLFDSFFGSSITAADDRHADLLQSDPFVLDSFAAEASISVPAHNASSHVNEMDDFFNSLNTNPSNTFGNTESNTDLLSDLLS